MTNKHTEMMFAGLSLVMYQLFFKDKTIIPLCISQRWGQVTHGQVQASLKS